MSPRRLRLLLLLGCAGVVVTPTPGSLFDSQGASFEPLRALFAGLTFALPLLLFARHTREADLEGDPMAATVARGATSLALFGSLALIVFPEPLDARGPTLEVLLALPLTFFLHLRRARRVWLLLLGYAALMQACLDPLMTVSLAAFLALQLPLARAQVAICLEDEGFDDGGEAPMAGAWGWMAGLLALAGAAAWVLASALPELPGVAAPAAEAAPVEGRGGWFVLGVGLLAGTAVVLWMRRRRRAARLPELPATEDDALEAAERAALGWPPGPRRRVVLRGLELLRVLGRRGWSRAPGESARDVAARVEADAPALRAPLGRVVALFERARYDALAVPEAALEPFEADVNAVEGALGGGEQGLGEERR